jgi:hypothetical protein
MSSKITIEKNDELEKLKVLRQRELESILKSEITDESFHGSLYLSLRSEIEMDILRIDPNDILSKELVIVGEVYSLLNSNPYSRGGKGDFIGFTGFGAVEINKSIEKECKEMIMNINENARFLLENNKNFNFDSTITLLKRNFSRDKTNSFKGIFCFAKDYTSLPLQIAGIKRYIIPICKKHLVQPLGKKLVDYFEENAPFTKMIDNGKRIKGEDKLNYK